MPSVYTPDATNAAQPADTDYAYIGAAELRTLKTYLAAQLAGLGGPINANAFHNRNLLINGDMAVWQRGTSATNQNSTYLADRWLGNRVGGVTGQSVSRVFTASGEMPARYAMKHQRAASDTSAAIMRQHYTLETQDSIPLAGSEVTLSFYAKAGANFSAAGGTLTCTLYSGTGTDQKVYNFTGSTAVVTNDFTLTTTATRFSMTGNVPTACTELGLSFTWTPVGTAGAEDSVTFGAVQLEKGSYASPFDVVSYTEQLDKCKRYYQTISALIVQGYGSAGAPQYETMLFPVELRTTIAPVFSSVTYSNASGLYNWNTDAEKLGVYTAVTAAGKGHAVFNATLDAEL
jgi:hypothetical protein